MSQLSGLNVLENSLKLEANNVRQEPPIPVERIVVTEKPMVETQKPVDDILVTPVITKMVEEEKMNANLHEKSQDLIKNDMIATETINKNKEKNNLIKKKEKHNFIDSDTIKKEESELTASLVKSEAANILVAERHEKLRKTLEKHKQEQLQMMREQKEILKDLEEQKQKIKRQKQKVIEDTKEYEKSKSKLKVLNETSATQVKMNFTINSTKKNESPKNQKENINNKIFNSTFFNNENINKKQNIHLNTDQILLDHKLNNEKHKDLGMKSNNSGELLKGPILNALTKRVLERSISTSDLKLNNTETNFRDNFTNIISDFQEKFTSKLQKLQHEYFLPIALKMRNQTNVENLLVEHKSEENDQVIHRDILENHEREKREIITKVEKINAKVTSDISNKSEYLIKNFTTKDNHEKCFKQNKKIEENLENKLKDKTSQNSSKSYKAETSLIKTNVYLSEQGFGNTVSMDSNIPLRGEYIKLKQRELKFVNIDKDYI